MNTVIGGGRAFIDLQTAAGISESTSHISDRTRIFEARALSSPVFDLPLHQKTEPAITLFPFCERHGLVCVD